MDDPPLVLEEVIRRKGGVAGYDPVLLQDSTTLEHLTTHMALTLGRLQGGGMQGKTQIIPRQLDYKDHLLYQIVTLNSGR